MRVFSLVCLIFTTIIMSGCQPSYNINSLYGSWSYDVEKSFNLRIVSGVPWYIDDKYGMYPYPTEMTFQGDKFVFRNKRIESKGSFQIINSSSNSFTIRLFPDNDRYQSKKKTDSQLIDFAVLVGDKVPFIMKIDFINNDELKTFSFVKGPKEKMLLCSDKAIWNLQKQ